MSHASCSYGADGAEPLLDALREGVVLHAHDGTILACNRAAGQLLGTAAEALVGHASLFPASAPLAEDGQPLPPASEPFWRLSRDEQDPPTRVRLTSAEGDRWLELRAVRLRDGAADGALPCYATLIGLAPPVADQVPPERRHDLERTGLLAAAVAHEFNNLLTVILGYSEMLVSDAGDSEPDPRVAQEIQRAAEQAARLTRRLLEVSRGLRLDGERVEIDPLLRALRDVFARVVGATRHIELSLDAGGACVGAERARIEQALLAVLENARHATAAGGRVRIVTAVVDGLPGREIGSTVGPHTRHVRIDVRDDGAGMSSHTLRHAFEPFFSAHGAEGLGLTLAQGAMRACRGHIEVLSELGRGTTVRIYLPALEPAHAGLAAGTGGSG